MKRLVETVAKALLPFSVRDTIRPFWHRLTIPSDETVRAREIAKVGPAARWAAFQSDELAFWDSVLNGDQWPMVRPDRTNPDLSLQGYLIAAIEAPEGSRVEILDVGAGPLTMIGKKWPGRDVCITAVDPIAPAYDELLVRHGITPIFRTTLGFAEDLRAILPPASFDLVHARNSIDHSKDPLKAITEMVQMAKPGCYVLLNHVISEGRVQKYEGFHQWNLFPRRGRFYIDRPGMRAVDVGEALGAVAEVSVGSSADGPEWFIAMIRRRA